MITVYKENGKVDIGGSIKLTVCFLVGVIIAGVLSVPPTVWLLWYIINH
jgi:hypothetical protein